MWNQLPLTYIAVRCKIDYRLNPFQRTVSLALIRVTASQLAVIFRREAPDYVNDDASHHRRPDIETTCFSRQMAVAS